MVLLKYCLHGLQLVSTLMGVNILVFDKDKRIFQRRRRLQIVVRVLHGLLFAPALFAVGMLLMLFGYFLLRAIRTSLKGSEGLILMYMLSWYGATILKIGLNLYTALLFNFRLEPLKEFLNTFVRIYDQCERLMGSDNKLRIRWYIILTMFSTMAYYDFFMLNYIMAYRSSNGYWFGCLFFFSLQSIVLSSACVISLLLLHAMFEAAGRLESTTLSSDHFRLQEVLQFYEHLLQLRKLLQAYVNPFIAVEVLIDLIICTMYMHLTIAKQKHAIYCVIYMIFPLMLLFLAHDIDAIEHGMGDQLLNYGITRSSAASDQLLEMFYLRKLLISSDFKSCSGILHLRRRFFFAFLHFVWVNGMFLSSFELVGSKLKYNNTLLGY